MKTIKNVGYSELIDSVEKHGGEFVDTLPGSLIDDLYISIDGGVLICFETYATAWSSVFTVHYFPDMERTAADEMWEKRKAEFIAEYGEAALYD